MRAPENGVAIAGVSPADMEALWPHVEGYFQSFARRAEGELTAGDLLHGVLKGQRQCWVATDGQSVKACALTEVLNNPVGTVQLNFCAGQDREEWRDAMIAEIEAWAAHRGSGRVRIVCRPGWAREIKGYRETHRVIEKEID